MADIEGLDSFLSYMKRVESSIDNIIKESLDETATMVIADTKLNTPVKTGALKRSWTHDNVEHNGDTYTVEVGSSLLYAPFVEEGHRQGNTFVQGRFMLKDSIDKNKDKLQQKINDKLSRLK